MANTKQKVSIARGDEGKYEGDGLRNQIVYRDLGVREATGGRYNAHIMRNGTGERTVPPHLHKLDLQMVYILKGWMKFGIDGRGEVTLKEGDCMVLPGDTAHEVHDWSDDFELLEVTSPADYETVEAPAG